MNLFLRRLYEDVKGPLFFFIGLIIFVLLSVLSSSIFFLSDIAHVLSPIYLLLSTITLTFVSLYNFSSLVSFKRKYTSKLWPLNKKLQYFMPLLSYFIMFAIIDVIMYFLILKPSFNVEYLANFILAKYVISTYIFMLFNIAYDNKSAILLIAGTLFSYNYFSLLAAKPWVLCLLLIIFLIISMVFEVLRNRWHWIKNTNYLCYMYFMFLLTNVGGHSLLWGFIYNAQVRLESFDYIIMILYLAVGFYLVFLMNDYKFKWLNTLAMVLIPLIASVFLYNNYRSPFLTNQYQNNLVISKDVGKNAFVIDDNSAYIPNNSIDEKTKDKLVEEIKTLGTVLPLSNASNMNTPDGKTIIYNNFNNHDSYLINTPDIEKLLNNSGFKNLKIYKLIIRRSNNDIEYYIYDNPNLKVDNVYNILSLINDGTNREININNIKNNKELYAQIKRLKINDTEANNDGYLFYDYQIYYNDKISVPTQSLINIANDNDEYEAIIAKLR